MTTELVCVPHPQVNLMGKSLCWLFSAPHTTSSATSMGQPCLADSTPKCGYNSSGATSHVCQIKVIALRKEMNPIWLKQPWNAITNAWLKMMAPWCLHMSFPICLFHFLLALLIALLLNVPFQTHLGSILRLIWSLSSNPWSSEILLESFNELHSRIVQ